MPLAHKKTAFQIVKKGGDYLSALKANQPNLYREAQARLDHQDATYICPLEKSHGRIEHRELRSYTIEESISSFPQSRQLLSLKRRYTDIKSGKTSEKTRHFITSLEAQQRSPKELARIIREHWSVENKNHWRRDTCRWKEDSTSTRNPKAAKNLAILRGALLALIPFHEHDSLNGAMDHYGNYLWKAMGLVNKSNIITP